VAFTTLLESSLPELNQAWKAVDEQPHANRFLSRAGDAGAGGWRYRSTVQTITLNFSDAFSAMRSLKGIGATHLHTGREKNRLPGASCSALSWPGRSSGGISRSLYQLFHGVIERD
jgi:malonyl-CoA O-methyltransferase